MEPLEGKMKGTLSSITISTRLERIAKLAREAPDMAFTTLAHHIDIAWLQEAYRRTRKDGATGVDRQTAKESTRGSAARFNPVCRAERRSSATRTMRCSSSSASRMRTR